jgi:hypothetical protein
MALQDMNADPMMQHLWAALERGETIGHYGRLVFAMVARHFVQEEELVRCLQRDPECSEADAKALFTQVQGRDYNPPRRERILEWQAQQEFPICPNADDPDACNVYKNLKFPDDVYQHIQEHQHRGQVDPAFTGTLHQRQRADPDRARVFIVVPALACYVDHLACFFQGVHLGDGHVRHVRPRLFELQAADIQLVVQFAHAVGAPRNAQENRRRDRDEGFHVAQCDVERHRGPARFREHFERLFVGAD